jgi:hypothetical protein
MVFVEFARVSPDQARKTTVKMTCSLLAHIRVPLVETVNQGRAVWPNKRQNIMSDEQRFFLSLCRQLPARLSVEQVGWLLNCAPLNIRILVRAGLLKPLGAPPKSGEKLFAADEVLEFMKNRTWLAKVTNAIHKGHFMKNQTRKNGKRRGVNPADVSEAA